jgi:hypothetical protein
MKVLLWNRVHPLRRRGAARTGGRRPIATRNLSWEVLDQRRLLTTMAATPAVLPVPTATAMASAAATLNALNPTAFAQFQTDLARAEGQSRVTPADVRKLARDEKIIDQTIESYSPDAKTTSTLLSQVQTDVDGAFLESTVPASSWAQEQQGLSQLLAQSLPQVHISTFVVRDTIDQMKVVARAAGDISQFNDAIAGDRTTLANDLGTVSNGNQGTGSAEVDAIDVYYDAQVNKFLN